MPLLGTEDRNQKIPYDKTQINLKYKTLWAIKKYYSVNNFFSPNLLWINYRSLKKYISMSSYIVIL